jgi:hypothetical protein
MGMKAVRPRNAAMSRSNEGHRKKHPRAPPVEIAGRQEEQDAEDGHVAEDPDDQLEDGVTPALRVTQDLEHREDELLGRATPGPRAHETPAMYSGGKLNLLSTR